MNKTRFLFLAAASYDGNGGGSGGAPAAIGGGSGDAPVKPVGIEGDDFELYGQGAQGAACGLGEGASCEACQ